MKKAKNPAERGFFWTFAALSLIKMCMHTASAQTIQRTYWDRLMHAEHGVSRVQSTDFFITHNGRVNLESERQEFIKILRSAEGETLACQFPARYKWLARQTENIPTFDLTSCTDLQAFTKGFQQKHFYIAFVSEYLDAPASAFGHLMLVFHDGQKPIDLADTIYFAATTNREGALQYAAKGLTGGFEGYFIREPFFNKKKDYLLFEQRAIHLYKIEFSADELENMTLHLYELRKAKFKYYFIDENCAFQLAELINIAAPDQDHSFRTNQPVLPIDVIRLHANHVREKHVLTPTIVREKYLSEQLSESEKSHVSEVVKQVANVTDSDSDQVKELLYLHYQYAFRRKRNPYPNHSEIESLKFKESSLNIGLNDPSQKTKLNIWSAGITTSAGNVYARTRLTPLGDEETTQQHTKESRLNLLEATVDARQNEILLHRLKVLSMSSTPNTLSMHRPWSWNIELGLNRDNAYKQLSAEAEIGVGKTWMMKNVRIETWLAPGIEQLEQTKAYFKPRVMASTLLTPELQIGLNAFRKTYTHDRFDAKEISIQYKNINLTKRITATTEHSILMHITF
jgi:hypothetical protein